MQSQENIHGYVVLIGVNDYTTFDRSLGHLREGQSEGPSQLRGSLHDVSAWWSVCRTFGFDPARIRVLTSPKIEAAELEGAKPGEIQIEEATEQNILAAAEWIAQKLAADSGAIGLVTYSGHGDWVEGQGLAICPSDITGGDLQHAIPSNRLAEIVDGHQVGQNLTVVLDCCHSSPVPPVVDMAAPGPRKALSLTGRVSPVAERARTKPVAERVLSACEVGHAAYQAVFAGDWHGAFTWALTSVLGQWQRVRQGRAARLDVSYGVACERAGALLDALSFGQKPQLHGPRVMKDLAFFQPGTKVHRGATSAAPDGDRAEIQADPTITLCRYILTLVDPAATPLAMAELFSVNITDTNVPYGLQRGQESWSAPKAFYDWFQAFAIEASPAVGLSIVASSEPTGDPSDSHWHLTQDMSTFNFDVSCDWNAVSAPSGLPRHMFVGKRGDGVLVGVDFSGLVLGTSPAPENNGIGTYASTVVTWYLGVTATMTRPQQGDAAIAPRFVNTNANTGYPPDAGLGLTWSDPSSYTGVTWYISA